MMNLNDIVARSEALQASGGRIEGGSPLAGHLGITSLLVREAVQNSWDARDDQRSGPVRFEMAGRDLEGEALGDLRSLMPVDRLGGFRRASDSQSTGAVHPADVLRRPSVRVLIVSDRNTIGLVGPSQSGTRWDPVRNGRPLERGQQRFANFVRNQGRAAQNIGEGDGGSYGIGKSALWLASECGTILIHTRTTDERGKPVERFIGSAYGEYFHSGGYEFTGRHFIGSETSGGLIEPFTGSSAREAARRLDLPGYSIGNEQVDGTSIVIIAPRLNLDWRTEMDRLRDAIRWHVWPKRVPGIRSPGEGPDMEMRLSWNNNPVDIPLPLEDPEIRPYARTLLDCARERKDIDAGRDHESWCHRPKKALGDVKFRHAGPADDNVFHLTRTESQLESICSEQGLSIEETDTEPTVDFAAPWGQIALVRREPLLLVRYEPIGGPDTARDEVGVFLSADDPEVEEALTKAEPPAHDDWLPNIVPKDHGRDHRRTFAKRTLEELKASKRAFLSLFRSSDTGHLGTGEQQVSRRLSTALFGGKGGGTRPEKPKTQTASVSRGRAKAILTPVQSSQDGERAIHELDVTFEGLGEGDPRSARLMIEGSGLDSVGAMPLFGQVTYAWTLPDGERSTGPDLMVDVNDSTRIALEVTLSENLRFRPKVTLEVNDES